jgi:hypothetical protein
MFVIYYRSHCGLRYLSDASRSIIVDSSVTLHIVMSLTIVIYNRNLFIVQATLISSAEVQCNKTFLS